jgi:peptidylprolyl isomerase
LAVANFVGLAEGTIQNAAFELGRPFFDGTTFHRVESGHVIQGGIPASERARGPGYVFPNEIHADLSHDHAGALNWANGGPHTNAAQFCITLGDRSYLDGDYIVFGEVVEGMDVVFSIARGDRVDSVRIVRVGAGAEAFKPDTESFKEGVRAAEERVAEHLRRKEQAESEWINENHPELEGPEDGVRWTRLRPPVEAAHGDGPIQVRYRGTRVRYVGHHLGRQGPPMEITAFGSGADGVPGFIDPPLLFPFNVGVSSINPGLDRILAEMGPGEARIVVVPSEAGFGVQGFFPRKMLGGTMGKAAAVSVVLPPLSSDLLPVGAVPFDLR